MSDSIENVLVKLMRDNNTHIDKSNKSQLVTNDLVKSLVDKFDKVMTQNKELEKLVIDLSNEHIYLTGKIETMEKEYKDQLDIIRVSTIATENMVMDMHRVKKPKVSKPVNVEPRVQCKCLTKKGDQCKKYCIPDHDTCKQHANMEVSSKPVPKDEPETLIPTPTPRRTQPVVIVKKRRKTPKPVKVKPPLHNHEPGETPTEPCELCISHGDILDPEMPDHEYKCLDVNGLSLEERLRIVVENEENGNPEDPEEPEEPEEPEDPGIGNDNWADMVDEDNNV